MMAKRRPFIMGNWKMKGTRKLLQQMGEQLEGLGSDAEVVIAPPFPYLSLASCGSARLAAQSCHFSEEGAFTGEVSARHLADLSIPYVIIGHSERRRGMEEGRYEERIASALNNGLGIVFCVGESESEREAGQTLHVISEQLMCVAKSNVAAIDEHFVIAYEPVWAIGTGKAAKPEDAQSVHSAIRKQLGNEKLRIVYGGSVTAANAQLLASQPDIDGFLVGGASLDPQEFVAICRVTF